MASIGSDNGGRKRILFLARDGKRRTIRLGKVSLPDAAKFKSKVEALVTASYLGGDLDPDIARWVAERPDEIHEKLAAVGLVNPRKVEDANTAALGAFIDKFVANKPDSKQNTLENMQQVKTWLVKFFGATKDMRQVKPADAEDWVAFMRKPRKDKKPLGENTIRRHIGRARQLWKAAIRREVVRGANPFEGMSATVRADKARQFFVSRDVADKVLAKCPDTQWKLLFALSRYGGLRCPSEHLALKWSDIDFDNKRIRVPSPKTEHHEGKESRMIPMFPELEPLLIQVQGEQVLAGDDSEHVITRYRDGNANLRTQLHRIIRKAGLEPWVKPWHNLRSTRETELMEKYPAHVVCDWIGNSLKVAHQHYLQVTDAHFEKAAHELTGAAQKAAQQTPEKVGNGRKRTGENCENAKEMAISGSSSYPRQDSNL